jgi:beta-mannosidase
MTMNFKYRLLFAILGTYALSFFAMTTLKGEPARFRMEIQTGWSFRQVGTEIFLPATVPGTVHTDLMADGRIPDPFYRTNERDLQWIDKQDWEYRTTFTANKSILDKDHIRLRFMGLDTYADVFLNDSLILRAGNFFLAWEANVKELLKEGSNELRVFFHSPIKIGLEKLDAQGYGLPAVNDQSQNGELGNNKVSVFTRKPGYHYGWDWGPRLVTSGIWRPVFLEAWDEAIIEDLFFEQTSVSETLARIRTCFTIQAGQIFDGILKVYSGDQLLAQESVRIDPGTYEHELNLRIPNPRLWWSNGLGEPFLYELRGVLEHKGKELDSQTHHIGLRTIRIVQEPDEKGSSFYVELNGVPVFAKGANYIPNDVFLPRVTAAQYENVVRSAAQANMNMLRVWGGGFYENNLFYELCDRYGILVWQDFMFACSMYPGDEAFLESVRREAVYNVRRLRNHPSIALWCGNNEIDVAWSHYKFGSGWGWKELYLPERRNKIWADYEKIFHDILPAVVAEHAPGVFYWPSSPYNRPGEHASYNSTSGDVHYWGVWHGKHPFSAFRDHIGRFMSEYGFQSFPEFETVKKYTLPQDWDIRSEVMAAHQRSGIGNLRIRSYMKQHYKLPRKFEHQLYIGQLLQAEGIKIAVEAHRTAQPYCMGTLYWQLNDCWPVASWSGMDYYQNWKALHYFVKKAFEPVAPAVFEKDGKLQVHVASDRLKPFPATLRLELIDFEGRQLWKKEQQITIAANTSQRYDEILVKEILGRNKPGKVALRIELADENAALASDIHYFTEVKKLDLPKKVAIEKSVVKSGGKYRIRLRAEMLVKNVFLRFDNADGFFSDNYFDLLPGKTVELSFEPSGTTRDLTEKELLLLTVVETL